MKKRFFSLAVGMSLLMCASLHSAEQKLDLTVPDTNSNATFFLDFSKIKADSATFKLKTKDGVDVPFSFDWSYDRASNLKPKLTWYTYSFPRSEGKLSRPGWLSFKCLPGVHNYVFSFQDGGNSLPAPRPNPEVRTWWIDLIRNPFINSYKGYSIYPKTNTSILKDGGLQFNGNITLFLDDNILKDKRLQGRRLICHLVIEADSSTKGKGQLLCMPVKGVLKQKRQEGLSYTFYTEGGKPYEVLAETVLENTPDFLYKKKFATYLKASGKLYEFHLSSPPQLKQLQMNVNNTVFQPGDQLTVKLPTGSSEEFLAPLEFKLSNGSILSGGRVGRLEKNLTPSIEIISKDGAKTLQHSNSLSFALGQVPAGDYIVKVKLLDAQKQEITSQNIPIKVTGGIQW